jgi:hypothetical protein
VRALCDGSASGDEGAQFAFGDDAANPTCPTTSIPVRHGHTGTTTNNTTAGWFATAGDRELRDLRRYLACETPAQMTHPHGLPIRLELAITDAGCARMGSEARMGI